MDKEPKESKSKKLPLYVQGKFDKHLNYKMWVTSGARFQASNRLKRKHKNSSRSISFLTSYVILFTLFDYLFLQKNGTIDSGLIIFVNITFSLLILVFSQLESASDYNVRALKYHNCAIEISDLYKQLRKLKTKIDDDSQKDEAFWKEVDQIDASYSEVLKRYDNHEPIDLKLFKANTPKYEDHNLNWFQVMCINATNYLQNTLHYHIVIFAPPVMFGLFLTYGI